MMDIADPFLPKDLSAEQWREYDFGKRVYRIDNPTTLYIGATTHRVVDKEGTVHIVPGIGKLGCVVRYKPLDNAYPVQF